MAAIKKWFQKKLGIKSKKAREGHRKYEEKPAPQRYRQAPPRGPSGCTSTSTAAPKLAAEAAIARMDTMKKTTADQAFQLARVRMKKQMEAERKAQDEAEAQGAAYRAEPSEVVLSSVLFKCPEISSAVLSKTEMEAHIHEYLLASLAEEPEMTSALMIRTLNKNPEKVKVAVDTLVKYIDNILAHPGEEKFRKIRVNNKAFQERVASLEGAHEFLQAVGFNVASLPHEDHEEEFYLMSEEDSENGERIQSLKDVLQAAEPLRPQLDRDLKVFHPSSSSERFAIPDDFYNISREELKREQQRQSEAVVKMGMLRTKAMRERDEERELRKYRYTLIRVRFPDGLLLQGTFRTFEKIKMIYAFIRDSLKDDRMSFQLTTSTGHTLSEEGPTLAEVGLAPFAVVNFSWEPSVIADIAAQRGKAQEGNYLKQEIVALVQTL